MHGKGTNGPFFRGEWEKEAKMKQFWALDETEMMLERLKNIRFCILGGKGLKFNVCLSVGFTAMNSHPDRRVER